MMELPAVTDFTPVLAAPVNGGLCGPPLYVRLTEFVAEETRDGVEVRWSTAAEINNAGFRLLRGTLGEKGRSDSTLEVVSQLVIPGKGNDLEGADYSLRDIAVDTSQRVFYILEDIDNSGEVTQHGPVWLERIERFRQPGPSCRAAR